MVSESTPPELVVVLCTAPSDTSAGRLAKGIVDARLAACVAVMPGVRSYYHWEGKLEESSEHQLFIKCTRQRAAEVSDWLIAHHPYDVPEVLVLPVVGGSEPYLRWVEHECASDAQPASD